MRSSARLRSVLTHWSSVGSIVAVATLVGDATGQDRKSASPEAHPAEMGLHRSDNVGGPPPPESNEGGIAQGPDILVNPVTNDAQGETTMSVNPLDPHNWIAAAIDYNPRPSQIGVYTTRDSGRTWRTWYVPTEPGFLFSADPAIAFDANGIAHLVLLMVAGSGPNGVYHYRSLDGGETWSAGTQLDFDNICDKPQIGADHSNGPHRGQVTVAWTYLDAPNYKWWDIRAVTSSDGGVTWSTVQQVNDTQAQHFSPAVAYGANSMLYILWTDYSQERIYLDRSNDGGVSFKADRPVTRYDRVFTPIPGSQFLFSDVFDLAVDWTDGPHSGNVYVTYHDWNGGDSDVWVAASTDRGKSWSKRKVHGAIIGDQVMPVIAVDAGGNVNVAFHDRHLDPNNFLLWMFLARSSDAGASFRNYQVSDVGFNHLNSEFNAFIGHYIDLHAGEHALYPCWGDARNSSLDVYTDEVQLQIQADVSSISAATGGVVNFTINIGPNAGGHDYLLLGSASGNWPPVDVGQGLQLPLHWDSVTEFMLRHANGPFLPGTMGVLDSTGSATAALDTQGPMSPVFVGQSLDFAVVTRSGGLATFVTHPLEVSIVP